jgi:hypothetical protein
MNNNPVFRVVGIPQPGYIYLVNAVGTNKFKIGKTRISVSHRIDALQTGCPIRLRYVYHAYVAHMSRTERELHYHFSCFRSIGEWFALNHSNVKECITLMRLVQVEQSAFSLPPEEEEEEEEEEEPDEERLEDLSLTSLPVQIQQPPKPRHRFHQPRRAFFPEGTESKRAEQALQLKAEGWGKAKIILEVWGVSKGGSPKYKAAEAEYRRLIGDA